MVNRSRYQAAVNCRIERCSEKFEAGIVYICRHYKEKKMSKKLVLVLLMATLLAGGAFAQFSMSAGLGGTFTVDFTNFAWTKEAKDMMKAAGYEPNSSDMNVIGGGFFAYFDATYAMLSLGMGFYDISPANADRKKAQNDAKITNSLTTFDVSLYGKYPFPLGAATLFPLLGVNFQIAVAQDYTVDGNKSSWEDRNKNDDISEYWSSVWFKFGAGADIPLGKKFYLRPIFLYGFGRLPKTTKESMDTMNIYIKMIDKIIYHGLDVKLAVGYKF